MRSDHRPALAEEIDRFQADIRRLAFEAVRELIKLELQRRSAKSPSARQRAAAPKPPAAKPRRSSRTASPPAPIPAPPAALEAAPAPAPPPAAAAPPPSPAPTTPAPGEPAATGRKRVPWTREAIINELATWMLSGTAIDATFVSRHGPPGLVAATRRVFGRFEAALNVAALHVSKLYPDGPPER